MKSGFYIAISSVFLLSACAGADAPPAQSQHAAQQHEPSDEYYGKSYEEDALGVPQRLDRDEHHQIMRGNRRRPRGYSNHPYDYDVDTPYISRRVADIFLNQMRR